MAIVKKLSDYSSKVSAQETTVSFETPQGVMMTGTVVDQFGEPLFGAHVFFESNPSLGTHTDENGNFTIAMLPNEAELIASYVTSVTRVPISEVTQKPILIQTGLINDEVIINASKGTLIIGFLIALIIFILSIIDNRKFKLLNN